MGKRIKVFVVDDHPVILSGLVAMLRESTDDFDVVGQASDPEIAIAEILRIRPDVVVTDISFEGKPMTGIDIVRSLAKVDPAYPCLVMTSFTKPHFMVEAFKAGAKAFLHKDAGAAEYFRAIDAADAGRTYFPQTLSVELEKWERLPRLTPAELRVLPYVALGLSSKRIAKEYDFLDKPKEIGPRTIDQHISNIKQKFDVDGSGSRPLVSFATKYCEENGIDYQRIKLHTLE